MSGRARLALCAWAATLMAACALLPLVDPATWILQAALLLAVQSAVGAAARRCRWPRPPTIAAQAVVTLVLPTLVFARQHALAGLIPGPQAFQRFADLLQQGGDDIARYAIPAPLESDGIRLMLIGGVWSSGCWWTPRGDLPQRRPGRAAAARCCTRWPPGCPRAAPTGCGSWSRRPAI